jgi:hypothetical protein
LFTTDAQEKAAGDQITGINAGKDQAFGYLGNGRDFLTNAFTNAKTDYWPAVDLVNGPGKAGYGAFADATGATGPEGLARAKALFTATPGYTEGINMALDQNDRRAAARGMLDSGGTIADTTKLATDYSNQKYGDYVSRLAPFTSVPGQATAIASGQAGVDTGMGTAVNNSFGTQAQFANNAALGVGNANASADLASLDASKNIWGAAMQVAKLIAGGAGGAAGGGAVGGNLGASGAFNPSMWNSSLPAGSLTGV